MYVLCVLEAHDSNFDVSKVYFADLVIEINVSIPTVYSLSVVRLE